MKILVDYFFVLVYNTDMKSREMILRKLTDADGAYVSGEVLASQFGISRNAVWKAVRALQDEGFEIESVKNRGYALKGNNDLLTESSIGAYLEHEYDIRVLQSTMSTNNELKKLASAGAAEWTTVVAEEQTDGRGRYDRRFYSPRGAGVYLSMLLRPRFSASDTLFVTTCAAVAVCEAIASVAGKDARIKWVNDVFLNGKKVCGILTEASFDVESNGLTYAIVGIGVDVRSIPLPQELQGVMSSVFEAEEYPSGARARLAATIMDRFRYYYERIPTRDFYPRYRERLLGVGARARVVSGNFSGEGEIVGLDEDCSLLVKFSDGSLRRLSSGEVSVLPNINNF